VTALVPEPRHQRPKL